LLDRLSGVSMQRPNVSLPGSSSHNKWDALLICDMR
jgi:hypothetical protein